MMSYVKNILRFFYDYFHNLKIFNTNLSKKYNFALKIFIKKIIIYFSSIGHRNISYIAKFKV
jgi:hypothetical protein